MNVNNAVSFDPCRTHFESYGLTCVNWVPTLMNRPDSHHEIELNLILNGAVHYIFGGRNVAVQANQLCLFWAGIPHQIVGFESTAPYYVATVPVENFLNWRLPKPFLRDVMQGKIVCAGTEEKGFVDKQLFEHWAEVLETQDLASEKSVALEMQARISRLATTYANVKNMREINQNTPVELSKADKMACFIARHYAQKLCVQDIADEVGVHANYAMNLYQKTFGMTINDHLTYHRLLHAKRLLITTDISISEIAMESGFQSLSRFNGAFNQATGVAPSTFRKSHHNELASHLTK